MQRSAHADITALECRRLEFVSRNQVLTKEIHIYVVMFHSWKMCGLWRRFKRMFVVFTPHIVWLRQSSVFAPRNAEDCNFIFAFPKRTLWGMKQWRFAHAHAMLVIGHTGLYSPAPTANLPHTNMIWERWILQVLGIYISPRQCKDCCRLINSRWQSI